MCHNAISSLRLYDGGVRINGVINQIGEDMHFDAGPFIADFGAGEVQIPRRVDAVCGERTCSSDDFADLLISLIFWKTRAFKR